MSKKILVHIRRCHICGTVNENMGAKVERCQQCFKAMAPFYFFDEVEAPIVSDIGFRPAQIPGNTTPILGITAYW